MGRASNRVKQYWPSLAATLLLGCIIATIIIISLRQNDGHLVYALDDSYILMAMAKNLARHGVWGVSPYAFTPNSSSPLWTLSLGILFRIGGVHVAAPLVLNLLAAVALIFVVQHILQALSPSLPRTYLFVVLLAVLFLAPVPNLIFLGLEHILHMVLAVLFAFQAGRILSGPRPPARLERLTFLALAMALGAIRYEGLFEVGIVVTALLVQRRFRLPFQLAVCACLPALVMGIISVKYGWFWLPSSVMLKGNIPMSKSNPLGAFLAHAGANTVYTGMRVVRLAAAALLVLLWQLSRADEQANENPGSRTIQAWMLGIFVGAATLHLVLARTGWFFRYEAYLIAWGLTATAVPLWNFVRSIRTRMRLRPKDALACTAVAVLAISAPLFWNVASDALSLTLPALHDTYRWHYQMGEFVARYYPGSSMVVNDIGAVNFMADIHCTDPHGLADREIARAILSGEHTSEFLDHLARSRGARVALVDDNWLYMFGGTPRTWLPAGAWVFPNRVVLAPPALVFYGLDEASRKELIEHLREFSHLLPADVDQRGPYRSQGTTAKSEDAAR